MLYIFGKSEFQSSELHTHVQWVTLAMCIGAISLLPSQFVQSNDKYIGILNKLYFIHVSPRIKDLYSK